MPLRLTSRLPARYETRCNTLQHTATHCNTLQHTATHCNTLQHTAAHCNKLQHTATHCNTLQHAATHCMYMKGYQNLLIECVASMHLGLCHSFMSRVCDSFIYRVCDSFTCRVRGSFMCRVCDAFSLHAKVVIRLYDTTCTDGTPHRSVDARQNLIC